MYPPTFWMRTAGQGMSMLDSRAVASTDGRLLWAPAARDRRAVRSTGRARTAAPADGTAGARGPADQADRTGPRVRPSARCSSRRGATCRDRFGVGDRSATAPEPNEIRQGGDEVRRPEACGCEEAARDAGADRGHLNQTDSGPRPRPCSGNPRSTRENQADNASAPRHCALIQQLRGVRRANRMDMTVLSFG